MDLHRLSRAAVLLVVAALWAGASGDARAAPYAAIVMDMRNGQVVHEDGADRRQHPASLTKMMTLYLTFEALESGQLRLDQKVRVSRHAARQPASKLYLKAGQRVSIRSLIRATAIKSANDAAMVLAEAIGGSQRGFAELMTRRARELGMRRTRFHNPHGLTQRGHVSTARDMATLARRLYFDFPEYYNVFGRRSAVAAGKRVYTTNRLLGSYRGAEGMKTGYTRAAGYNLVGIAARGARRVVAVVMGGRSSRWRNRRVADLLDRGFERTPARAAVIPPRNALPAVAEAPLPRPRPGTPATGLGAIAEALASPAAAAVPDPASRNAPLYAERPQPRPGGAPAPAEEARIAAEVAERIRARAASGEAPAARGAAAAVPVPAARPGWRVQVGAYRDHDMAVARLESMELSGLPMLARGASGITRERSRSGRPMYKVRFHGLDREAARAACARLKRSGRDCLAIAPR
jgi:D-alanyl-D-alanine carboxypeptidase